MVRALSALIKADTVITQLSKAKLRKGAKVIAMEGTAVPKSMEKQCKLTEDA